MKRECAVVQDLLVLYEDNVLKEQSRQMVEEHIRGCEECMRVYETAEKNCPILNLCRSLLRQSRRIRRCGS